MNRPKIFILVLAAVLLWLPLFYSGAEQTSVKSLFGAKMSQNPRTAFINVNVIPMDAEKVIENQTVLIDEGKISAIGDTEGTDIPSEYSVIDAGGKYLMPGLVDMHVHINNENELILFLAHGVTTVRNMWGYDDWKLRFMGFPDQKQLRDEINAGKQLGPTIFTSGRILEGEPLTQPFMRKVLNPAEAENAVVSQKKAGYDFIKVYNNLSNEVFQAIISTAEEQGIPVAGHVPKDTGLDAVLESGMLSIEHLTGYTDPDAAGFVIDEESLDDYCRKTAESGIWNVPTIVIWQKLVSQDKIEEMENHPGMKYLSWMQRFFLKMSIKSMRKSIVYKGDYVTRMLELDYKVVDALHRNGAGLLLGTDSGNPFVFPGWSVHEELLYLTEAGLTPFEALLTGTLNAAECLGKSEEFGTVEVGKRADLLLLNSNPLDDVKNASDRAGVMVKGLWFPKEELAKMMDGL